MKFRLLTLSFARIESVEQQNLNEDEFSDGKILIEPGYGKNVRA
jgi:hypothetical protein